VPCFAVQYSTSPQKRNKEGGRALSDEAPLGMSMEMLTFGTNLGGYRTDITEQQIRGAPAFSRDQTSTNGEGRRMTYAITWRSGWDTRTHP
jgi:hypothetical protein